MQYFILLLGVMLLNSKDRFTDDEDNHIGDGKMLYNIGSELFGEGRKLLENRRKHLGDGGESPEKGVELPGDGVELPERIGHPSRTNWQAV